MLTIVRFCLLFFGAVALVTATRSTSRQVSIPSAGHLASCPDYRASNGYNLVDLKLVVEYQTDTRLHVQIYDSAEEVYQVPATVVARPNSTTESTLNAATIRFELTDDPFSFAVVRADSNKKIFDSSSESLVYGNHPIYFELREASYETHGVFLLNSNGMDIKINNTAETGQYLEYNILGGIIDLYFLAGPSPIQAAQQYSEVIGKATMMPYWCFGFHQCRYGMQDIYEVADVAQNYSLANIPLETMRTDIDYMDIRKVFTVDPLRFPLEKV
ncbi:MAG: hypothetical protein MMC33_005662 [Icmadophila ericetorum]|nr:hypothetical protein [Icmadophila ericetorum]